MNPLHTGQILPLPQFMVPAKALVFPLVFAALPSQTSLTYMLIFLLVLPTPVLSTPSPSLSIMLDLWMTQQHLPVITHLLIHTHLLSSSTPSNKIFRTGLIFSISLVVHWNSPKQNYFFSIGNSTRMAIRIYLLMKLIPSVCLLLCPITVTPSLPHLPMISTNFLVSISLLHCPCSSNTKFSIPNPTELPMPLLVVRLPEEKPILPTLLFSNQLFPMFLSSLPLQRNNVITYNPSQHLFFYKSVDSQQPLIGQLSTVHAVLVALAFETSILHKVSYTS